MACGGGSRAEMRQTLQKWPENVVRRRFGAVFGGKIDHHPHFGGIPGLEKVGTSVWGSGKAPGVGWGGVSRAEIRQTLHKWPENDNSAPFRGCFWRENRPPPPFPGANGLGEGGDRFLGVGEGPSGGVGWGNDAISAANHSKWSKSVVLAPLQGSLAPQKPRKILFELSGARFPP